MADQTPVSSQHISVEIVYALPDRQSVITLAMPHNCTAQQAVEKSGLLSQYPEIPWPSIKLGIFGKIVPHHLALHDGDRIEIYRPLTIDPKEARRLRGKA